MRALSSEEPHARLLCFSGAGFTDGLVQLAAPNTGVVLIGPAELYAGSGS